MLTVYFRYNLSHLEQWLRDSKLQESGAGTSLEPIIQASQLLQARKTEADVESVCDMCSKLSIPQVSGIIQLLTIEALDTIYMMLTRFRLFNTNDIGS